MRPRMIKKNLCNVGPLKFDVNNTHFITPDHNY